MKTHARSIVLVTILLFYGQACANEKKLVDSDSKGEWYGSYTNICEHQESGDYIGVNIFIVPGKTGTFSLFQEAEGAIGDPILIKLKTLSNSGNDVEYEVDGGVNYPFDRLIYKDGKLRVRWANGRIGTREMEVDVLEKVPAFPASVIPICVD